MNTILHRMERDGQLERRPHPSSPRADSWYVTARGSKQMDHAKVVGKAIWRRMLAALARAKSHNCRVFCIAASAGWMRRWKRAAGKAGRSSSGEHQEEETASALAQLTLPR
jgi:DNA-binding MarR family transcriptional regulator